MRYEAEEIDGLAADDGDPWTEGFVQGEMEILDSLIPAVSECVDAILAEDVDLPESVLELLEVLDRWMLKHKSLTEESM
jgi:hypothetical protein